jgi:hypothetical protein
LKNNDLSSEIVEALETLRKMNDEENRIGPPAPETELANELVKRGLIQRVTRPIVNDKNAEAIVGHEITDKGREVLRNNKE